MSCNHFNSSCDNAKFYIVSLIFQLFWILIFFLLYIDFVYILFYFIHFLFLLLYVVKCLRSCVTEAPYKINVCWLIDLFIYWWSSYSSSDMGGYNYYKRLKFLCATSEHVDDFSRDINFQEARLTDPVNRLFCSWVLLYTVGYAI